MPRSRKFSQALFGQPSKPDGSPTEIHEYSPGAGNLSADVSLMVLSNGISLDAFELAGRVLRFLAGIHRC